MKKRVAGLVLAVMIAGGTATFSQQSANYGPFVPTPEWGRIMKKLTSGNRAQGVAEMRALAARERGTTVGANALATAGVYCEDSALYRQLLDQIISEYPNSTFSLQAQMAKFDLTPQPTIEAWMSSRDQLYRSLGAPTVPEVFRNRRAAVAKARNLPLETLQVLMSSYFDYANVLRHAERYRDCIELCQFGDEASFQKGIPLGWGGLQRFAFNTLTNAPSFDPSSPPVAVISPEVVVRSPQPNRKAGPRPNFHFDIRTGDYKHPQAMHPVILLDGGDITSSFSFQSKLNLKLKKGPNVFFEVSRYSYRPSQKLSPGSHTITVTVDINRTHKESEPGKTVRSWNFFVAPDCDEGDDDDDLGRNEDRD